MASKPQETGVVTFQTDVGPGDVTGVYYITICNLPFETSWQQLKDWLRPHCEVDHIEVFNTSTSGWVRVQGRENFDKAWNRLNGGIFHGRSIIASDKNKSEAIKVKELIDFNLNAKRHRPGCKEAPMAQPVSPALYGSPMSITMTPQTSKGSTTQYFTATISPACPPMGSASVTDYAMMPHYTMPPMGGLAFAHALAGKKPAFRFQHRHYHPINNTNQKQKAFKQQVPTALPTSVPSASGPVHQPSPDHYKIMLKNVPHRSGAKDIDIWVRRRLGSYERGINGVDVPIDNTGLYARGHAVLRFSSLVEVSTIIKKLHQHTFRGRTVSASILEDEAAYAACKYKTVTVGPNGNIENPPAPSTGCGWTLPTGKGPLVVRGLARKGTGNGN